MRTLMLIASIAMMGTGIFCVANSSAAFLSVAFVIGLVMLILGAGEVLVGRRADFDAGEMAVSLTKDGMLVFLFGLVIISGQITDDTVAQFFFGLWICTEGILTFREDWLRTLHIERKQRLSMGLSILMVVLGIYMFFNSGILNIPTIMLIGFCLIALGLRRCLMSFNIEYTRPSFITGNEEKLREAQEDEKRALAKAKEGIREQKNAQRRIQKIEDDIAAEQDLILDAQMRKQESEAEPDQKE